MKMKLSNCISVDEFIKANRADLIRFEEGAADAFQALKAAGLERLLVSEFINEGQLHFALSCSPFLASVVERYSEEWINTVLAGSGSVPGKSAMQSQLNALTEVVNDDDQNLYMQQLREFRHIRLGVIALHDLTGIAPVPDVLQSLSDLADVCIENAVSRAERSLAERFGHPVSEDGQRQSLMVVGMGKLGGGELNFSSDVDLVFLHSEAGETDGNKSIDNEDYFRRVGQLAIKFLDAVTSDGFVYRVDMRLRPLGRSGPLVINLDAMENYLVTQGRDWERFAWIKARVICGSEEDRVGLQSLLRPFIYRRYLDYSVFDSLRDLKRQIGVKVEKEDSHVDIKLGRGGIREIEFITQSFQLVRGGRDQTLQNTGLRASLRAIADLNLLGDKEVDELLFSYDFLRKIENRLQMVNDQQTHELPETEVDKRRLALSLCYKTYEAFEQELMQRQNFVQKHFDLVFSFDAEDSSDSNPLVDICLQIRDGEKDKDRHIEILTECGLNDASEIESILREFYRSGRYVRYLSRSRELIDQLMPVSLRLISGASQADGQVLSAHSDCLKRLLEILHSISGRSGYLQLLADSDATLSNLLHLLSQSPWLAEYISGHPMVLDELLDIGRVAVVETVDENVKALKLELALVDADDLGELMDRVRHFQQARTVRIAAADISGAISVMKVSDALTWLAEAVLQVATEIVTNEMERRHGQVQSKVDGKLVKAEFAVVAYGKLGGIELGYGSDLDIVFLHQSDGEIQQSNGERPLESQVYFARMAQKLVHFLTTTTPAGVLYEIDTRLRPNGRSGVLVISLTAFEDYQLNSAWTWEHQALVRTRVVVGNQELTEKFKSVRAKVLQSGVKLAELKTEVRDMRERMRSELDRGSDDQFDLKQGSGGIADIEFMVQYLVLKNAKDHSELLAYSDNVRQIEGLQSGGFLSAGEASQLAEAYLYLRGLYHKQSMQLQDGVLHVNDVAKQQRDAVIQIWQQMMV